MSKLYRARSLLYRRQILQENIRWKALDEIYKIYMFLHRSDLVFQNEGVLDLGGLERQWRAASDSVVRNRRIGID